MMKRKKGGRRGSLLFSFHFPARPPLIVKTTQLLHAYRS